MLYNLVFTIYGFLLIMILLITFFVTLRKNFVRSKIYGIVIFFSLLFCIVEIIEIHMLYYTPSETFIISTLRRINHICTFSCISFMVIYFNAYTNNYRDESLYNTLFKVRFNLIVFICNFVVGLLFLFVKAPEILDINNLMFLPALHDIIVCYFGVLVVLLCIIKLFKNRKSKRNLFLCLVLIFVLLFIGFPFQLMFQDISLVPFMTLMMIFIIYFTVENPDITLLEDVSKFKEEIDKSSDTKIDFLYQLCNDLITPVNSVVSLSDSLRKIDYYDEREIKRDLNNINMCGSNILDSVGDIFELVDEKIINKKYSLYNVVNFFNSYVKTRIKIKNLNFDINVDDSVNSQYIGDINKIQKILKCILSNAIKYTDVGKIKLHISSRKNSDNVCVVKFIVSDTGRGIKDEEKSLIFTNKGDKGFNLFKCKELLSLMNGTITFDSVYGGGSTFSVEIVQGFVFDDRLNDLLGVANKMNSTINDYSQFKVLLVDDDSVDIKVMTRMISGYNFNFLTMNSSVEFINKIKSDETYDLVFLSHNISDVDGVETIKVLRQLDGYILPKIICLSSNTSSGAREYYKSIGFDDYLAEPIDKFELDNLIKNYLKK